MNPSSHLSLEWRQPLFSVSSPLLLLSFLSIFPYVRLLSFLSISSQLSFVCSVFCIYSSNVPIHLSISGSTSLPPSLPVIFLDICLLLSVTRSPVSIYPFISFCHDFIAFYFPCSPKQCLKFCSIHSALQCWLCIILSLTWVLNFCNF